MFLKYYELLGLSSVLRRAVLARTCYVTGFRFTESIIVLHVAGMTMAVTQCFCCPTIYNKQ